MKLISAESEYPIITRIIIFLNLIVFLMWTFPSLLGTPYAFLAQNFTISWDILESGRYWNLVTSAFSHIQPWHFLLNMFVLLGFGKVMEFIIGPVQFILFYLIAAIVGSFSHAFVSAFLLGEPGLPAVGASGAIAGVLLLFALMYPKRKILFFAIIPIPALWGALLFMGLDVWGLVEQSQGGGFPIGHGAHLGGALTGIIYYFIYIRPQRFRFPPASMSEPI